MILFFIAVNVDVIIVTGRGGDGFGNVIREPGLSRLEGY